MKKKYVYVVIYDDNIAGVFTDVNTMCKFIKDILSDSNKYLEEKEIKQHILDREKKGCCYLFFPEDIDSKQFTEEFDLLQVQASIINGKYSW